MSDLQYYAIICATFAVGLVIFHRQLSDYAHQETRQLKSERLRFSRETWSRITTLVAVVWTMAAIAFYVASILVDG